MMGTTRRLMVLFAAATMLASIGAGAAVAQGKGNGGGSTITLVLLNSQDGLPHWGQQVTFDYTTNELYPVGSLVCKQNGIVVYGDSHPMYWPNAWSDPGIFTLSSAAWTSGAADCDAYLLGQPGHNGRSRTLAKLSFHVEP